MTYPLMGRYTVRMLWSAQNPNFLTIDCFPSLGMSQNEITANILTFVFMKRDFLKDYCVEKVSFFFFISSPSGFVSIYNSTHLFSASLSAAPRQNCLLLNGVMSMILIKVTPWGRVLIEKLAVPQRSEKSISWSPNVHYRIHNSPSVVPYPE
jgi:hypothetical protein